MLKSCHTLALFALLSMPAYAGLKAGAAVRPITPDLAKGPHYLAGFGQNRKATAIHDDLFVRCVALSTGQTPLVLCGVDVIGLFLDDVERIRAAAKARLGRDAHIVIAANHGHEGPDTMGQWGPSLMQSGINDAYQEYVIAQAADAIAEAVQKMRGAEMRLARDSSNELKAMIDDDRPPVVNDAELVVLQVRDGRGRPIATLVNWANHPEALGSKNTEVTADYLAAFYRKVPTLGGGVAVFLNGAIGGMQSPLGAKFKDAATGANAKDGTFEMAEAIGRRVAELAIDAANQGRKVDIDRIEYREKRVTLPVANPLFVMALKSGLFKTRKPPATDNTFETLAGAARLSRKGKPVLEIACVPGELYPELSVGGIERYAEADSPEAPIEKSIKRDLMTAPYKMLFGLAGDEIGYIIPKAEWDEKPPYLKGAPKRWYGEINSTGPEAAPLLIQALAELLAR